MITLNVPTVDTVDVTPVIDLTPEPFAKGKRKQRPILCCQSLCK